MTDGGEKMMVSVHMISYNHEQFIAKAIEGVMMQKTNFEIELIISDDHSTDQTRAIIKSYEALNPGLIKPVYRAKNIGSMANFIDTFSYCKGKYIAICDGDDYWTDPLKLQLQIDFLEANADYVLCAHGVKIRIDDVLQDPPIPLTLIKTTFSIADLAKENLFYTTSVVFRNGLIDQWPSWIERSPVGDYVLHMLNARKGLIKYMPESMAVYRQHSGGIWSKQDLLVTLEKWIRVLSFLLTEEFDSHVIAVLKMQKRATIIHYLQMVSAINPALFKDKIKGLMQEDPDFAGTWLLDIFTDNYFELKEISNTYNNLKNSRLRKGLSSIFKQLKM